VAQRRQSFSYLASRKTVVFHGLEQEINVADGELFSLELKTLPNRIFVLLEIQKYVFWFAYLPGENVYCTWAVKAIYSARGAW
jgi:hypothetical protein